MITRTVVALLVALAVLGAILEFSSVACEDVRPRKPPVHMDAAQPDLPVASELDAPPASQHAPEITF